MIPTFKLEEYLGKHEFSSPYILCASDAESFSLEDILSLATEEERHLWKTIRLGYTEVFGLPSLRETIAKSIYPGLNDQNILCFAGAEEGIFCTLSTLLKKDDHVIVLSPCYQSLSEIPKYQGCHVTEVPLREDEEWRINLQDIEHAITPQTRWLVINFPHNPTGQTLRQNELEDLIKLLDHHGIWLFSDEAYRLLGEEKTTHPTPAACLYDKAISLGVMSKAYGMAGLRVGWIACQNQDVLHKISLMKHYTSICNSTLSEVVSLITLNHAESVLQRNRNIVTHNLKMLDAFFEKYSHMFSWTRPTGGCVGFVRYHGKSSIEELCNGVRKSEGVLLLPGSVYQVETPHFRIGFGRKNMADSLQRFENYIKKSHPIE